MAVHSKNPLLSAEDSAFAAIVRSSQDAVIAKTTDGVVTAWNDGATATYGYSPEDMLGSNIDLTVPQETTEKERERRRRVAAGEALSGYRCLRLRKDGQSIEVVMSMLPVCDRAGFVTGVASISRLVNQREREADSIAALLEAAPDAIICVNSLGLISLANTQVSSLFGYDRDELLGRPIEVLVPQALRGRHVQHRGGYFAAPLARSMGSGMQLSAQRRDGSTFPVEVSLSATPTSRHSEPLVIAAVRDVSDKRAMEASLRESEIRLRQLAENVEAVTTLQEVEPRSYLYISPQFESLTGYSSQEMFDDPESTFAALLHPEDHDQVLRLGRSFTHLEPTTSEFRIVRRDGSVRWVRSTYRPVKVVADQRPRLVGTTEDITERVLAAQQQAVAEAEAKAANAAKNEFLSRMSHELRTPLNAVLGFAQLLELDLEGTRHVASVHHILRGGRHLLALINDVLDVARIEAGEISVSLEPVSVGSLANEVCRLMEPIADKLNVSVRLAETSQECFALADSQRLRQILLNLVTNGIKYNFSGGHVWLGWTQNEDAVTIEVSDDGQGIANHLQPRLFTPFDRLGAEATSVEGTGVGLAITRGLAELMNGTVDCQSDSGHGAHFSVTLPVAASPERFAVVGSIPERADRVFHIPGGARTLLYIEDNVANVQLMESVLTRRSEWKLLHAALAGLGVELARAHHPDLVMLDLHLPDGSGLDVLLTLCRDPATANIPIVVLSADASPSQIRSLVEAGAKRYLTKPLNLDEMLHLLDEVALLGTDGTEDSHEL